MIFNDFAMDELCSQHGLRTAQPGAELLGFKPNRANAGDAKVKSSADISVVNFRSQPAQFPHFAA